MKEQVKSYTCVNESIVNVRFKVDGGHLTVIRVYALEESKELYEQLQSEILKWNSRFYFVITGDMNARVEKLRIPEKVDTFGEDHIHNNWLTPID